MQHLSILPGQRFTNSFSTQHSIESTCFWNKEIGNAALYMLMKTKSNRSSVTYKSQLQTYKLLLKPIEIENSCMPKIPRPIYAFQSEVNPHTAQLSHPSHSCLMDPPLNSFVNKVIWMTSSFLYSPNQLSPQYSHSETPAWQPRMCCKWAYDWLSNSTWNVNAYSDGERVDFKWLPATEWMKRTSDPLGAKKSFMFLRKDLAIHINLLANHTSLNCSSQ